MPRDKIREMYDKMKNKFPYLDMVLALVVLSSNFTVVMAMEFDATNKAREVKNNKPNPTTKVNPNDEEEEDEKLHKLEQCTLEYFLTLIQLKSQKQLSIGQL